MNRRDLLKLLVALSALAGCTVTSTRQQSRPSNLLEGLDSGAIENIGREYRDQFPRDHEVEVVKNILSNEENADETKIDQLRLLMLDDFENGQTVNLSGWIVSRTEGRTFAAAAEILSQ